MTSASLFHASALRLPLAESGGQAAQDRMLISVANKAALRLAAGAEMDPVVDAGRVDDSCPGLSVAIRALHSVLRDAVGADPRPPKDSDFVDAIHAMHAPCVSLFRADRYMAGHLARLLPKGSATVVPRLDMLLGSIRKLTA